jgi:hypothetical protein
MIFDIFDLIHALRMIDEFRVIDIFHIKILSQAHCLY